MATKLTDELATFTIDEAATLLKKDRRTIQRYLAAGELGYHGLKKYKDKNGQIKHGGVLIGKSHVDEYVRRNNLFLRRDWFNLTTDELWELDPAAEEDSDDD